VHRRKENTVTSGPRKQVTKREAIKNFLIANTHPDLAGRYNPNMEVQVGVRPVRTGVGVRQEL
jgi:hypothetical protein